MSDEKLNIYLDSDIILKLCKYELEELLYKSLKKHTLYYNEETVKKVKTDKYFPKDHPLKLNINHKRFYAFINNMKRITQENTKLFGLIKKEKIKNIDSGELQIAIAANECEEDFIYTGDKRFIKAYATSRQIQKILPYNRGKIVCFEQIVLFLLNEYGFEEVNNKIVSKSNIDGCIEDIFSQIDPQNELISNIKNFRNDVYPLLSDFGFDETKGFF